MSVYNWAARPDPGMVQALMANTVRNRIGQVTGSPDTIREIALSEALAGSPNVYNVKALGAVGDGTTNDYPVIQAAITAAGAAGGGVVYCPTPSVAYGLRSNLSNTSNAVKLIGDGPAFGQFASPFSGTPSGGTIFRALSGCTIMLAIAANSGAANRSVAGCTIEGISFDCNSVAAVGLALSSVSFSRFNHLYVSNATVAGISSTGVATLNDNRTPTRNKFDMITIWNDATNGDGIVLDGPDDAADTGGNLFGLVQVLHKNGNGIVLKNSDSNIFDYTYCNCIGTGIGVIFHGNNTSTNQVARDNLFRWLSAGSVTAKGTSSYSHPSRNNIIELYDFGSNSNYPTIETGAGLAWMGNRGFDPGSRSQARGDESCTLYPGTDARIQYYALPLTANRTVTISSTGIDVSGLGGGGSGGRVVRAASATGASTLTVITGGVSRILAVGQWCDWTFDAQLGASTITAFGSL